MPALVVAGAATLAGSLIAKGQAEGAEEQAMNATQEALKQIAAVGAPPDLSKQIFLDKFQQAGILTPAMEHEINVQFQKIAPAQKSTTDAQKQALQQLAGLSKTGLNAEDRLAQAQLQTQNARNNEANQNSIIQNLQARGQAGGGAELAARLAGAQSAAQNQNMGGLQIAANAQARALQALSGMGNLAGQMRSQDFGENQANASIANEQNRFNTANQLAIQQANTNAQNQAQQYNLGNAQNISNANTQMGNAERLREAEATRQNYLDRLNQATGMANARIGQGTQIAQYGANNAASTAGMFGGAANAIGAIGQYQNQQAQNQQSQDNFNTMFGKTAGTSGAANNYGTEQFKMPDFQYRSPEGPNLGFAYGGVVPSDSDSYVHGGQVPGHAQVPGNSPLNDTVPAFLSPQEIVVPRNIVKHNSGLAKKLMELIHKEDHSGDSNE